MHTDLSNPAADGTTPIVRARLFGELQLEFADGRSLTITSKRSIAVLGRLLLVPGAKCSRSELAADLWPDALPSDARRNLRQVLFAIHKVLDGFPSDWLGQDESALWVDAERIVTDLAQFEACSLPESQPEKWQDAIALYRGPLLAAIDEVWIVHSRSQVEEQCVALLLRLANEAYRARDLEVALDYARRIINIDPLSERGNFALVRILAARDQVGAARLAYQSYAKLRTQRMATSPTIPLERLLKRRENGFDTLEFDAAPTVALKRPNRRGLRLASVSLVIFTLLAALALAFRPSQPESSDALLTQWQQLASVENPDHSNLKRQTEIARELGTRIRPGYYGPKEREWQARIQPLIKALYVVQRYAIKHDRSAALRIGADYQRLNFLMGSKGVNWSNLLNEIVDPNQPISNRDEADAYLAWLNGYDLHAHEPNLEVRIEEAIRVYRQSGSLADEFHAIRLRGFTRSWRSLRKKAREDYFLAYGIATKLQNPAYMALCELHLSMTPDPSRLAFEQRIEDTIRWSSLAIDNFCKAENEWGIVFTLDHLASFSRASADTSNRTWALNESQRIYQKGTDYLRETGALTMPAVADLRLLQYSILLNNESEICSGILRFTLGNHGTQITVREAFIAYQVMMRTSPEFVALAGNTSIGHLTNEQKPEVLKAWIREANSTNREELLASFVNRKVP